MTTRTKLWASFGATQEKRLPLALEDDYVLPFEKSLAHELASFARMARSVVHADGQYSDWQALFDSEPAIALAELITLADAEIPAQNLDSLIRTRLKVLSLSETASIHDLQKRVSGAADFVQDRLEHNHSDFSDGPKSEALLQHKLQLEEELERRLKSGDLDPALGLLLAALTALTEFKTRLNQFPDELLNHYYEKVLGLSPREGEPTNISLRASVNSLPVDIPNGTVLAAVLPDNSSVSAKTIGSTRLVAASVQKLYQLRYWRDQTLYPINALGWVSSVAAEQVGEGGSQLFSASKTPPLGLLIESPIFALSGGTRDIKIRLDMAHQQEIRSPGGHGEATPDDVIKAFAHDPEIQQAFSTIDGKRNTETRTSASTTQLTLNIHHWVKQLGYFSIKWIEQTNKLKPDSTGPEDEKDVQGWNATDTILAALLLQTSNKLQFSTLAGRIVRHALLSGTHQWPNMLFLGLLRDAAQRANLDDPPKILGNYEPKDLFFLLMGDAFHAEISSSEGLFAPSAMYVEASPGDTPGVTFTLHLNSTAPPVEAMEGFQSPHIRLTLSSDARFSPISVFENLRIDAIDLSVSVKGLTQLFAFNDDGPLAVSQTMLPFGSQPKDGSEFLVGSPEIGNKSIERICLSYTLSDLPPLPDDGALDSHYAYYGEEFHTPDPRVDTALLCAGGWVTVSTDDPLIGGAVKHSDAQRHKAIDGSIANPVAPPPGHISELDFAEKHSIRAGLVRVRLETSGRHFGANTYPLALAKAIRRNQIPFIKPNIPNPPLTIKFSSVSLDYRARRHISIRTPAPANSTDRIVQFEVFGTRQLYPATSTANTTLFPPRLGDGNLFIGIGPNLSIGPVSLLFDFDEGGRERLSVATNQVSWHVLTNDGWLMLSANSIYADTTEGLHRTGVVTLKLPDTTTRDATEMPSGLYWIAATATHRLDSFPFLKNVYLNGMSVSVNSTAQSNTELAKWIFEPSIPGLGDMNQIGATWRGGRPRESKTDFRARVSEGLLHRQRGVTAWDIERIVLDKYSYVWKCKCFPCYDGLTAEEKAGSLTVLVIPFPPISESRAWEERMFDSVTLDEIKRTVVSCMNTFANIVVRNPSFERLQVRAEVSFEPGASEGALARRLTRALSDRLSVWTADEPMNGLGWSLNIEELEAFAERLSYVRSITYFEILHLVHDRAEDRFEQRDNFMLKDSTKVSSSDSPTVKHYEIWSLPLSMSHHIITSLNEEPARPMKRAGIGELSVGETLLVQSSPESKNERI